MRSQIIQPLQALLDQLKDLLHDLTDEQYVQPIAVLSGASVGQHLRHIIEFFQELEKGYRNELINYDARKRDHQTETSRSYAVSQLISIAANIHKENKTLKLVVNFDQEQDECCEVTTTYQRELVYNLEHAIHHMALLKAGIRVLSITELPDNFGVAVSTIKHRNACAQ